MRGAGSPSPESLAEHLGRTAILSTLTPKQLRSLAKSVKVVSYPANAHVVKQGEPGIALYLLLQGSVEVRQGTRTLARLGPGQFFGEMTLLDEQPRSADVVTLEPAQCAVLARWEFWGFAKTEPDVLQAVAREMARRLRETTQALSE